MRFLDNLTLVKKITLLGLLGTLLVIGAFSFLSVRAVSQATDRMLQDRLTTAYLVADYIDDFLGRALTELKSTAQTMETGRAPADLEKQIAPLEYAYSRLSIYIHGIYLLNEQGRIIWSKPDLPGIVNADISFYPGVAQAVKGETITTSLVSAPVTGTPVVFLMSPTKEAQMGGRGVLVVAIDIAQSSIGGFVQPIRLGQTGYVEIVDENGIVVARTDPGPKLAPFEKSDHSGRFAALISAGKPTEGTCHTCHEAIGKVERRDVLAFVPLTTVRWGVIIRQSEAEALAPVRELRQNLLIFGAALIAIAFVVVTITTRDVMSRIRMLTAASRRMAGGDLVSPVTTSRKDEVGVLAQTFDDMRTKLKASYDRLEQRTRELSSLLSISEILASLPDLSNLDEALGSALDKALELTRGTMGGVLLFDEDKKALCYRVQRGLSERYVQEMCLAPGEGIAGTVAQTGEATFLEDISSDQRAAKPELISIEGLRAFASVPLRSKNRVIGVLNVSSREAHKFSTEDVRLLEAIAAQMATAIENARLHQEVRKKDEVRGELLREMLLVQEEERRRIARELHDETSQVLASLNASLEAAAGTLPTSTEKAEALLRKAQTLSINILDEIHRVIYELRPSLLDDLGLVAATRWLLDNKLAATGITVDFKTQGRERRLTPQLETTLFRVIQEAASNIARHAQARNVDISLHFKRNAIRVRVKDDGVGFTVAEAIASKDRPRGLGLLGMKERVGLVNGSLEIRSQPGSGTEIDIEIPLDRRGT